MTVLAGLLTQILHIVLVLLAAPTVTGLLTWLTDVLLRRDGPPALQHWRDLLRLMRKQPVLAPNASLVVRGAPVVCFTLAVLCAALVPSFALGMTFAPMADGLTVAGLLGMGRVILILAAMDAGTGAGGIAATRVTSLAILAEPILLLAVVALALLAGTTNLDLIIAARHDGLWAPGPAAELAVAALAVLGWAETAMPPLDGAFSARDLALIQVAEDLRRLVWFGLIVTLACPFGIATQNSDLLGWGIGLFAWVGRLVLAVIAMTGMRLLIGSGPPRGVSETLGIAVLLCLLGLALALGSTGAP